MYSNDHPSFRQQLVQDAFACRSVEQNDVVELILVSLETRLRSLREEKNVRGIAIELQHVVDEIRTELRLA